jgi:hypothetical protein
MIEMSDLLEPEYVASFRQCVLYTCLDRVGLSADSRHTLWFFLAQNLDPGAWRTITAYYALAPQRQLEFFLEKFFQLYYLPHQKLWVVRNPSAAAVALCRKLGWNYITIHLKSEKTFLSHCLKSDLIWLCSLQEASSTAGTLKLSQVNKFSWCPWDAWCMCVLESTWENTVEGGTGSHWGILLISMFIVCKKIWEDLCAYTFCLTNASVEWGSLWFSGF